MPSDVIAIFILSAFWIFVGGPAVFASNNATYKDAVAGTVIITAFLIAVVLALTAVAWAIVQLTG